jgi:hypothetical protein
VAQDKVNSFQSAVIFGEAQHATLWPQRQTTVLHRGSY